MIDYSSAVRVDELFIGRKLVASSGDIRLLVIPELTQIQDDGDGPVATRLRSQSYKIFVSGQLFASVVTGPKRPRLHSPISLWRDNEDGKMRLRLVKRYTELA